MTWRSWSVVTSALLLAALAVLVPLLRDEGEELVRPLAVPIVAAVAPIVLPRSPRAPWVVAILLSAFTFLAMASIGMFFIPAVLTAWMAVANRYTPASPARPASPS